jgi:hypothetical protein
MAQGEAARTELGFHIRAAHTGFECGQPADLIKLFPTTEATEVKGYHWRVARPGVDVADHAGASTVWDHAGAALTSDT